jgi:hypothetical protein
MISDTIIQSCDGTLSYAISLATISFQGES